MLGGKLDHPIDFRGGRQKFQERTLVIKRVDRLSEKGLRLTGKATRGDWIEAPTGGHRKTLVPFSKGASPGTERALETGGKVNPQEGVKGKKSCKRWMLRDKDPPFVRQRGGNDKHRILPTPVGLIDRSGEKAAESQ